MSTLPASSSLSGDDGSGGGVISTSSPAFSYAPDACAA
jgi:hypothetical protein